MKKLFSLILLVCALPCFGMQDAGSSAASTRVTTDASLNQYHIDITDLNATSDDSASYNWMANSPDRQILAVIAHDGAVRLWRRSDGTLSQKFYSRHGAIISLFFSPDGQILATRSGDGFTELWRVARDGSTCAIDPICALDSNVNSVNVSPDGQTFATCSFDEGTAALWRADGTQLAIFLGLKKPIYRVEFSSDGTKFAAFELFNETARIWHVETGEVMRTFAGPNAKQDALNFLNN